MELLRPAKLVVYPSITESDTIAWPPCQLQVLLKQVPQLLCKKIIACNYLYGAQEVFQKFLTK